MEEKSQFIYNIMRTIEEHPDWAGEAIQTISYSVGTVGNRIQGDINIITDILQLISQEEKARLAKRGIHPKIFDRQIEDPINDSVTLSKYKATN